MSISERLDRVKERHPPRRVTSRLPPRVVRVVAPGGGVLIVLVLLARIAVTLVRLGQANGVVGLLDKTANALSLGTLGLFTASDPRIAVLLNSSTAMLVWSLLTVLLVVLGRAGVRGRHGVGGEGRTGGASGSGQRRRRARAGSAVLAGGGPAPTRMPPTSRMLFTAVAIVAAVETAGFAGTYLLYSRHYVYTDNANVDGDKIEINAPVSGTVTNWSIDDGSGVRTGQIVGRIQSVGDGPRLVQIIKAPGSGIVANNAVTNGSYVSAGTNLATAYDPSGIYVTARVKDTDIAGVHLGAPVDIHVDSFPDTPMSGIVTVVQNSAAGEFTIYPAPGIADPSNPQKVNQYIPVRIALIDTGGVPLAPGMNVVVHIHKQAQQ